MDRESTGAAGGILRRLAALAYDLLLTVALLFVATFALLPLSGFQAITPAAHGPWEYLYRAWLLAVAFAYYGWSWTRGRTLGMAAWRLRLVAARNLPPGWGAAMLRFAIGVALICAAVIGAWWMGRSPSPARAAAAAALCLPIVANYAWPAFDAGRRTLQDRLCGMRMVRV